MPSQSLIRLSEHAYAIVDGELLLLVTDTSTFPRPILLASAFKTRASGWRLLRSGVVDIGYAPDAPTALQRILDDANRHPSLYPSGEIELDMLIVGMFKL